MFIIIHQISELWMKLALHELGAAAKCIAADNLRPAFKMLSRVVAIQSQLIEAWAVLSTMTPTDYLKFRDQLGQSSGFQSYQYRQIEYFLGNKKAAFLAPHRHDEAILLLSRRGFASTGIRMPTGIYTSWRKN